MIDPGRWQPVCRRASDIPDACRARVGAGLADRLGGTVDELFPDLARALPATVDAMQRHGSRPTLLFKPVAGRDWLADLVVEQPDRNLFFDINGAVPTARDGSDLEARCGMLPPSWQALLDRYLAHRVGGAAADAFDFRSR